MGQFDLFYSSLRTLPEEKDVPSGKDIGDCGFLRNWGFTIYRTAYDGPACDQHWQSLLADMQAHVETEINRRTNGGAPDDADRESREILALFRLDPRSDKQRLAGLSMQQVRQLFLQDARAASERPDETRPMNWRTDCMGRHVFLLVDDEVMAAAAVATSEQGEQGQGPWVKCVYADYRAEDYVPKSSRVRQRFFGWMKMTTRCLAKMWEQLEMFYDLEGIAPPMADDAGQNAEIYDGW